MAVKLRTLCIVVVRSVHSFIFSMRHRNKKKILKRKRKVRQALERSLLHALINYEKIETTFAKAKVLRSDAERLITKAKENTMYGRRLAARLLDARSVKKLFDVIGPRYKERKGGYTRITKKMPRKGDSVPVAIVEFV